VLYWFYCFKLLVAKEERRKEEEEDLWVTVSVTTMLRTHSVARSTNKLKVTVSDSTMKLNYCYLVNIYFLIFLFSYFNFSF